MTTAGSSATPPPQFYAATDWFLQSLVRMVNEGLFEVSVTLQVSGLLVSGTLVSGKKYFARFGDEFAAIVEDKKAAASIRESFASHGDVYDTRDEEDHDKPSVQFIHLADAKFFNTAGEPIPANQSVLWRGRVSEVAGFVLGGLAAARR